MTEERTRIPIVTLEGEMARLHGTIIGQEEAVTAFANLYAQLMSGIRSTKPGPLNVKFLAGPSGVGKTELVLAFAEMLSGEPQGGDKVIVINGPEYQEFQSISRLFGSPPGYVGSRGREACYVSPVLSAENVAKHRIKFKDRYGKPKTAVVILIDEAEKACLSFHQTFLSVLDKGKLDMADNTSVNFSDAIILYTSNIGNHEVEKYKQRTSRAQKLSPAEIVTEMFRKTYPPEYRGRIDEVIIFRQLMPEEIRAITLMKVKEVEKVFKANDIEIGLELSPEALAWLIARGYREEEGVRSMAKVVKRHILDKLRLANGGVNLNGKQIYVDVSLDPGEDLVLFSSGDIEGKEVSGAAGASPRIEIGEEDLALLEANIRRAVKNAKGRAARRYGRDSFDGDTPFKIYVSGLVEQGIVPSERVIVTHPAVIERVVEVLKPYILRDFDDYHDALEVVEGLGFSRKKVGSVMAEDVEVVSSLQRSLRVALNKGLDEYYSLRDDIVATGFSDKKQWNDMFKERISRLRREYY